MSGTIRWIVEFPEGVSKNELEFEQKLTYPIKVKRKKKVFQNPHQVFKVGSYEHKSSGG